MKSRSLCFSCRHVLHQQSPWHFAAFHQTLIHAEDIATPLRLVGAERTGRMEDARIDQPAGAHFQAICFGKIEDAVVALVPVLEAFAHLRLGRAGLEAHECVREIIPDVVVLRRKVIGLGLAFLADQCRLLRGTGACDAGSDPCYRRTSNTPATSGICSRS